MKQRETRTPGIPDIRADNVAEVVRAIKDTLQVREGRSGDPLDQNVTLRHLTALGLATPDGTTTVNGGGDLPVGPPGGGPGDGYDPGGDLSTPPAPEGLEVHPGGVLISVFWIGASYRNHAYTEIWRSAEDLLASAVMIGTSPTNLYADPVDFDSTYWYWIRFVSKADVRGPYNAESGTMGHTMLDSDKAILALSSVIVGSPLWMDMTQRISQIQSDAIIANRTAQSTYAELAERTDTTSSRLLSLQSVSANQATRLDVLESRGAAGNRTFFTDERPDLEDPGIVGGIPLLTGDIWYDTNDSNRSYRWSGTTWVEFISSTGTKVYHQPNDPNVGGGADSTGRLFRDGDLWYDSDSVPPNHPWLWQTVPGAWADIAGADNTAGIITLEQTKIGYATLNVQSPYGLAGAVYDANGLIWNNVATSSDPQWAHSAEKWNTTHNDNPGVDSKLTWHVGLPFAQATKQVGITADNGATQTTVQQQFTAMQTTDTGLLAQYTVKIDANGYVSGFGLASTAPGGPTPAIPSSLFMVNADRFAIGPVMPANQWSSAQPYLKNDVVWMSGGAPAVKHVFQSLKGGEPLPGGGTGPPNLNHLPKYGSTDGSDAWWVDLTVRLPFIATSSAQTINGKTYPPGVWMNAAHITEASINSAQIANLDAGKITTGYLYASISVNTGQIYGGIDPSKPIGSSSYGTGYFLGNDGGTHKFYIGTNDVSYLSWDPGQSSQLTVVGNVWASGGQIGGINMFATGKKPNMVGNLYAPATSNAFATGNGFFLDSNGLFRIGKSAQARLQWDGAAVSIYNDQNKLVMSSGGLNWDQINGSIPPAIANTSVTLTSTGTLNGAGGGSITASGLNSVTPGAGILNQNVTIQGNPNGTITLSGAGVGGTTAVPGIGNFRITFNNISTFIDAVAITRAYIGTAAIGAAQIEAAVITNAHIASLSVDTLWIANNAVTIPIANGYDFDEAVTTAETVLFGGPVAGGAIVEFALPYAATLINVVVTSELDQAAPTTGGSCTMVCYLNKRSDSNYIQFRSFKVGIINNQPRFAQTASFTFTNVPGLFGSDRYFLHISAKRDTSGGGNMLFGKKTITVTTYKK
jgi:hypothetical protein